MWDLIWDSIQILFWILVIIIEWAIILGIFIGIPVLIAIALIKYIIS